MRLLWATILALCVLGALVRAASCEETGSSDFSALVEMWAEGPPCPECPVCEGPWGFDASIEIPDHAQPGDVLHVELRPAYLKQGGKAAVLRGRLDRDGRQPGVWAERIQPEDAVPEPPLWSMVVGGVVLIAVGSRLRPWLIPRARRGA